jgi:hypothetical protein
LSIVVVVHSVAPFGDGSENVALPVGVHVVHTGPPAAPPVALEPPVALDPPVAPAPLPAAPPVPALDEPSPPPPPHAAATQTGSAKTKREPRARGDIPTDYPRSRRTVRRSSA